MEKRLNPEHVKVMLELIDESPFISHLGVKTTVLETGHARGEVDVERVHYNAFGGIHGGMYAAMMDHIAYWSLYPSLPEDMGAITMDLHTDYLRACTSGHLICDGRVVKQGRQLSLCEVQITDAQGRMMAHGTSKMMCSPTLQPVSAIIKTMRPGLVLPPKWL